jgi:uncharacterized protein
MARPNFLAPLLAQPDARYALVNAASGETIAPIVEPAFASGTRRRGLLGRDRLGPEVAFIIAPSNAIHTFGMRFPIDVLFVSRNGEVVKRVIALRRRRIAVAVRAFATIEFCANHPGVAFIRVGDGVRVQRAL